MVYYYVVRLRFRTEQLVDHFRRKVVGHPQKSFGVCLLPQGLNQLESQLRVLEYSTHLLQIQVFVVQKFLDDLVVSL
jgi:hypothetical protein